MREQLALTLTQHGLQRMTARVLAALLFSDQDTITAGEIADQLDAGAGSVSTAIKMLSSTGLVERVLAPASRREHYRFPVDGWARLMSTQNQMLQVMQDSAQQGIASIGNNTPGPPATHNHARLPRPPTARTPHCHRPVYRPPSHPHPPESTLADPTPAG
ncbi:MAG: GbsR/MarR family transcriptional regulator [Propionicimonas sp.]